MCGRFSRKKRKTEELYLPFVYLSDADLPEPSYNIAPGAPILVVVDFDGEKVVTSMLWGLVPFWVKKPDEFKPLINARGETLSEKPSFRSSFKSRRCVIPADGFYEWSHNESPKQPYYFRLVDDKPMFFAGLYNVLTLPDGSQKRTAAIITTGANELMSPIHDRMPVILDRDRLAYWLESGADKAGLEALLKPYPASGMENYPMSSLVNSPKNDSEECIKKST